jgi:benzodiazapine receptor
VTWYDSLAKPSWTPAPSVIGTIWTIVYPIIFVVFGYVIVRVVKGEIPSQVVIPIAVNLAANVAFTPIQFGLQNLPLATADILVVLVTIVWAMIAIWPYSRVAALALTPYLAWVSIASVLQVSITLMNRGT